MPYANPEDAKAWARRYYLANREKKIAAATARNKAKPEAHREACRRYDAKPEAKVRAAAYYQEHKDRIDARSRQWARDHPERSRQIKRASERRRSMLPDTIEGN